MILWYADQCHRGRRAYSAYPLATWLDIFYNYITNFLKWSWNKCTTETESQNIWNLHLVVGSITERVAQNKWNNYRIPISYFCKLLSQVSSQSCPKHVHLDRGGFQGCKSTDISTENNRNRAPNTDENQDYYQRLLIGIPQYLVDVKMVEQMSEAWAPSTLRPTHRSLNSDHSQPPPAQR